MQTAPLSDAHNSLASDHGTQPFQVQTLVKADRKMLQFKKFILQQQCTVRQMCWKTNFFFYSEVCSTLSLILPFIILLPATAG